MACVQQIKRLSGIFFQMSAVFIIPDRVVDVQDGLGNFGEFIWNLSKAQNCRQRNYAVPAIPQGKKCIIK